MGEKGGAQQPLHQRLSGFRAAAAITVVLAAAFFMTYGNATTIAPGYINSSGGAVSEIGSLDGGGAAINIFDDIDLNGNNLTGSDSLRGVATYNVYQCGNEFCARNETGSLIAKKSDTGLVMQDLDGTKDRMRIVMHTGETYVNHSWKFENSEYVILDGNGHEFKTDTGGKAARFIAYLVDRGTIKVKNIKADAENRHGVMLKLGTPDDTLLQRAVVENSEFYNFTSRGINFGSDRNNPIDPDMQHDLIVRDTRFNSQHGGGIDEDVLSHNSRRIHLDNVYLGGRKGFYLVGDTISFSNVEISVNTSIGEMNTRNAYVNNVKYGNMADNKGFEIAPYGDIHLDIAWDNLTAAYVSNVQANNSQLRLLGLNNTYGIETAYVENWQGDLPIHIEPFANEFPSFFENIYIDGIKGDAISATTDIVKIDDMDGDLQLHNAHLIEGHEEAIFRFVPESENMTVNAEVGPIHMDDGNTPDNLIEYNTETSETRGVDGTVNFHFVPNANSDERFISSNIKDGVTINKDFTDQGGTIFGETIVDENDFFVKESNADGRIRLEDKDSSSYGELRFEWGQSGQPSVRLENGNQRSTFQLRGSRTGIKMDATSDISNQEFVIGRDNTNLDNVVELFKIDQNDDVSVPNGNVDMTGNNITNTEMHNLTQTSGNLPTCDSTHSGAIMYNGTHWGCDGTSWNPVY